jgi:20S proteasome alpha/beta subunit
MTALVGMLCSDGVVMGSDSSATFSANPAFRTIEQRVRKIEIIEDRVIVAGTGEVGMAQRFGEVVRRSWAQGAFRQKPSLEMAKELARLGIDDFAQTHAKTGTYGALVAFPATRQPQLCEFSTHSFQPELKTKDMWFVSMGSGQPITDPFLALLRRVFWPGGQPSVKDAISAVAWTLQHVIEINPGGINGPPQIAVMGLTADKEPQLRARLLDDDSMAEHLDGVRGIEEYLARYKSILSSDGMPIPSLPS